MARLTCKQTLSPLVEKKPIERESLKNPADTAFRLVSQFNPSADPKEFRRMVERDAAWFFKLVLLCPKLRVLRSIVGANLEPSGLVGFLHESAPRHGFKVIHNGGFWEFWHGEP